MAWNPTCIAVIPSNMKHAGIEIPERMISPLGNSRPHCYKGHWSITQAAMSKGSTVTQQHSQSALSYEHLDFLKYIPYHKRSTRSELFFFLHCHTVWSTQQLYSKSINIRLFGSGLSVGCKTQQSHRLEQKGDIFLFCFKIASTPLMFSQIKRHHSAKHRVTDPVEGEPSFSNQLSN